VTTRERTAVGLWRIVGPAVRALLLMATLGTLAAALARWAWPLELAVHFRWQMLVVMGLCALAAGLARRARPAALALIVAGVNAVALAWSWGAPPPLARAGDAPAMAQGGARDAGAELRLVHLNVQMDSDAKARAGDWLAEARPDVVTLVEVDDAWLAALRLALPELSHVHAAPRPDFLGAAVLSRFPILASEVHRAEPGGLPWLRTVLDVDGRPLTLVTAHALPPIGERWVEASRALLTEIAAARPSLGERVVVCADFNLTPWSPSLSDFAAAASLIDLGGGWGTWPAAVWPMRIPIDRCFASADVVSGGVEVGPDVGSDHLPVVVTLGR
jgi:endonuclease/exonuclease/phosphatase (EEP) superfamily protein YafD